jgi:quercetin dioxygenase-like cupin family protein
MDMHKKAPLKTEVLDDDVIDLLLENIPSCEIDKVASSRIKASFMETIKEEEQGAGAGFETIRANEGEWIEALPGGRIKILHQEENSDVITYLAELSPGFEMPTHDHLYDEECLMLEGEMWLGELCLKAGDYHFASKGVHHGRLYTKTGATALLKGALPI